MKICSKCNNEVRKTDLVCPKCGFSLLRDKYGKRIDNPLTTVKNMNYKFDKPIKDGNNKSAPIIAIVLMIISFIIPFICLAVFEDTTKDNEVEDGFNNDKLNSYMDEIKLVAEDYYQILIHIYNNEALTIEKISEFTSLDTSDMTSNSCILLFGQSYLTSNGDLALNCVLDTHQAIGTFSKANDDMNNFYQYVDSLDESEDKDLLIDLYGDAYDLYYLPGTEFNLLDYEASYNELINDIDNLMEELNM